MKNSTFSQELLKVDPARYIECFICEQNMLGVGIGVACRDRTGAFASTFAAFLTRGFDNLRMGVISQTNLNVVGSHCGVSIGEDGPSQMALEDIAMFRSLPGCTVFYPSDAVACERAVELSANQRGICFVRVSRPATAVIYENNERFDIGKAKSGAQVRLRQGAGGGRGGDLVRGTQGSRRARKQGGEHQSDRSFHHQANRHCCHSGKCSCVWRTYFDGGGPLSRGWDRRCSP